jgi:hypothetical protein
MKFTNGALTQVLLGSRDVATGRQILDDLLANPTALEDAGLGVGEGPLEVWDHAVICGLLAEVGGVLEVELCVGAAWRDWCLSGHERGHKAGRPWETYRVLDHLCPGR